MDHKAEARQIVKSMKAEGYTDFEDAGDELTQAIEDVAETAEDFDAIEAEVSRLF